MICNRLNPGDTIGLISPSSPAKENEIELGIKFFKDKGFNVKVGKNIYNKIGYLAGSDLERAEDVMSMFLDSSVKMILCIRGGYGVIRTLPYLNFDIIKNNPKLFIGFSDITTYLNIFYNKCGFVTFHGPMLNSNFDDITINHLLYTLTNGYIPYTITNPSAFPTTTNFDSSVTGILVGGNLSTICSTLGTDYEIDTNNKILFLEEVNEEPYSIDKMFTQLLLCNKLNCCKGIILGQFTKCSLPHYERSLTLSEVISDRILSLNKPTIMNFMSGHGYPKLTLPIGANIRMNSTGSIDVLNGVVL